MPAMTPWARHTAGTASSRRRCSGSSERGGNPIETAKSLGPMNTASTPLTATISSSRSSAGTVSTITAQTTDRLASSGLYSGTPSDTRVGPQLRYPSGGYRQAPAAASACSGELTIGTTTPAAPASRAFMIQPGSSGGTLTIDGTPAVATPCSMPSMSCSPIRPCWMSMQTQSKPARAMTSAVKESGTTHQPPSAALLPLRISRSATAPE